MSRREENRASTTQRMLDAALKVFAEYGYSGASMDAIAAAAGISKPTLYHYFDSKAALFRAMMTAQRDILRQSIRPEDGGDMVDQLTAFAWSYARTVMRPEFLSLARLIIGEASRFPEIGRHYQAAGPDRLRDDLARFMTAQRAKGRLTFEDAILAAEDFWGLILSAPRNRALHDPEATTSKDEVVKHVGNGIRVFLRAYSTAPEADQVAADKALQALNI